MTLSVVLSARARTQLRELFQYIASEASPDIAKSYTDAIVNHARSLGEFPNRGTPHDDIRPGVRTIPFRGRVTIAYTVKPAAVRVLGIFYAGQDLETILREI